MQFLARKHKGLRVVLDPRVRVREMGRSITQSLTGDTKLGLTIEFVNGIYETDDKLTIKLIKNHPRYGLDFFSDEAGEAVEPTVAAVAAENEKKAFAEELRSTCPKCGAKFKNEAALNGHMRTHAT